MMANHGDPCDSLEATYCMNGGTCYRIPSMDTLSCVCNDNYKGSRCEQFQLFSRSRVAGEKGLIAAVVIVVLLILLALAVVIYYSSK
ncbi:toxin Bcs III 15.09 [Aplochiton taeniatus]